MDSLEISAAGLRVQRARMDVIAANLANVDVTSARAEGPHVPYRRRIAQILEGANGLPTVKIVEDRSEFRAEHQPGHPHASAAGTVLFPNVNPMVETMEMMAASRAYEANLSVVKNARQMAMKVLEIGK